MVTKAQESAPDVREVDSNAPFQSVKDAVSLFGDAGSPASASTALAKKKAEEGLIQVEAQHHLMVKERLHYTNQLRTTEAAKAQALRELQLADKTLDYLRNKLQTLTNSKQSSIAAAEAARVRAVELEERESRAPLGKSILDNEWELFKSATAQVIASKEELTNLRKDYDAVVVERLTMLQKAEGAQHELQKDEERQGQVMKEVEQLRQTFDQAKQALVEVEEEYMKLVAEKEELLNSHKLNQERVEKEIKRLEEEYVPSETLQANLDETMEAIRVLQEQLHDMQSSDLYTIRQMASELDSAKRVLEEAVAEENMLRASNDSTKKQLEEVQSERTAAEKAELEAELTIEQMQGDLEKSEAELEKAKSECGFNMQSRVGKLLEEAEMARHEAESNKKSAKLLREEAKAAAAVTEEADEKLKTTLKEAEEAKGVERLAEEQIYCYEGHGDGSGSTRRITLSAEEFDSMNEKIKEYTSKADIEVATAIAEAEAINAREKENSEKLEALLKENEALELEIKEALKAAEMAEADQRLLETELQKRRQNEVSKATKVKR
ncbi:WEB family protein At1g12150-like [Salvia hispanica]|uniref:WEB family protein At1g12150-like n=1 Tax=Salvia hispanica TaxID=49212 RepID=UPI0020091686|nr:WEB family protein At1g12150-like [Salvia hispanica]